MLRFALTRLGLVVPTFLGITLVAFFLIRLVPGDPIETMAGERGIDPARHESAAARARLRPAVSWSSTASISCGSLHGDLGKSVITQERVLAEFASLFPATVELGAVRHPVRGGRRPARRGPGGGAAGTRCSTTAVMAVLLAGYSMPIFWWGLLLILLFSVQWIWTPVSGRIAVQYFVEPVTGFLLVDSLLADYQGAFRSALAHLVLPTVVLGTVPLAVIAR